MSQPNRAAPDSAELTAALESAEKAMAALKEKEDQFLRLAAEYDNYRHRRRRKKRPPGATPGRRP